nr:hypothetical protein Iba_chr15fCG5110 [Ipomoea batatas]
MTLERGRSLKLFTLAFLFFVFSLTTAIIGKTRPSVSTLRPVTRSQVPEPTTNLVSKPDVMSDHASAESVQALQAAVEAIQAEQGEIRQLLAGKGPAGDDSGSHRYEEVSSLMALSAPISPILDSLRRELSTSAVAQAMRGKIQSDSEGPHWSLDGDFIQYKGHKLVGFRIEEPASMGVLELSNESSDETIGTESPDEEGPFGELENRLNCEIWETIWPQTAAVKMDSAFLDEQREWVGESS